MLEKFNDTLSHFIRARVYDTQLGENKIHIAFAMFTCIRVPSALCCQKVYHPTTNYNFYSNCLIPVIFGVVVAE